MSELSELLDPRPSFALSSAIVLPPLLPIPVVMGLLGGEGCSQECLYCYNKKVAKMLREIWKFNPLLIHTEGSTHICWSGKINQSQDEQDRFNNYLWEALIEDDIVCATIEGDPGDPKQKAWFWKFLRRAALVARLVYLLTKFPLSPAELAELAKYPNVRLVHSITGIGPPIEGVTTNKLLRSFKRAKEAGVIAFPAIHPYVGYGVSKLDFLEELLGYLRHPFVSIRGLSFDPETMPEMAEHMTPESLDYYRQHIGVYALPDDGWAEKVAKANMQVMPLGTWLLSEARGIRPGLSYDLARARVLRVWPQTRLVGDLGAKRLGELAIERLM